MMNLEIGDKVLIRNDLVLWESYGADAFVSGMMSMRGKVATVTKVWPRDFRIAECGLLWTPEMCVGKIIGNRVVKF